MRCPVMTVLDTVLVTDRVRVTETVTDLVRVTDVVREDVAGLETDQSGGGKMVRKRKMIYAHMSGCTVGGKASNTSNGKRKESTGFLVGWHWQGEERVGARSMCEGATRSSEERRRRPAPEFWARDVSYTTTHDH